jgi:S-formylglutathione hydrolase
MEQISSSKMFGGRQLRLKHFSETLSCDMHFSVYMPPETPGQMMPVLYWLSGLTCTDENFVTKAGAQQYAAKYGVAIIAPDTSPRGDDVPDDPESSYDFGLGAGFYVNATQAPWSKHYRMYDYMVDELPALVATNFAVDRERASIFGHSMGGHGALTIALKNPEKFRSASAFAPICSPIRCPWGQKALGNYLGGEREVWAEYDTCELIAKSEKRLPILVDQGGADGFLKEQLKTDLLLNASVENDYPMDIRIQSGYDHSYFFIASFIEDHIRFHRQHLG